MSLLTFIHSDWATKRKKFVKWWHRNDWKRAHSPSLATRIKTEWYYMTHKNECMVVDGWLVKFYETKETYMNWGDDLNVYMLERMTGKKVVPAEMLVFKNLHHKYACIGSVLPSCMNRNTIVWGSGCMNFELQIIKGQQPKAVKAVRGPLTRKYLMYNGIECPEVYGDPALLLPLVYQPKDTTKKYKISFIPHHRDWDDKSALYKLIGEYKDVHVINMTDYDEWTDVIDEIVQSEVVLSSSLHGLIVSDAYGVPNEFVEFMYHHPKYDKYEDYYASVKRHFTAPIILDSRNIDNIMNQPVATSQCTSFKIKPLMDVCPFNIELK